MKDLRKVMDEINADENLTEFEKGFAQFSFANRSSEYFLEVAAKCLKKSVKDLKEKSKSAWQLSLKVVI